MVGSIEDRTAERRGRARYGRGGEPTVTDAHLVLSHLRPYLLLPRSTWRRSAPEARRGRSGAGLLRPRRPADCHRRASGARPFAGRAFALDLEASRRASAAMTPRDFVLVPFRRHWAAA